MVGEMLDSTNCSEMILNARVLRALLMYHCFKAHKSKEKQLLCPAVSSMVQFKRQNALVTMATDFYIMAT